MGYDLNSIAIAALTLMVVNAIKVGWDVAHADEVPVAATTSLVAAIWILFYFFELKGF